MNTSDLPHSRWRLVLAWLVHLLSASGAILGLASLISIHNHQYVWALGLMLLCVGIDAIDGTLARLAHVKTVVPHFDGATLDNIVDYISYVLAPCFFLYVKPGMLPPHLLPYIVSSIAIFSLYQFCQSDAKTYDNYFKGFPCYWNIVVFYMFIFDSGMYLNAAILLILCGLLFVPLKYLYPSRLDFCITKKSHRMAMHLFSLLYAASFVAILVQYPRLNFFWILISLSYVSFYILFSAYRNVR
jgi:phosphatidylcholine synthase